MLARGYPRPRFLLVPALLITGLAAITLPQPALGRNWLVLIDGSGDAPTIQAAVDSAAAAGDSILVGPGNYGENVVINGKGLVMRGLEGRDQTMISTGGAAVTLTGNGEKKIIGLTLQGSIGADGSGRFESCAFSGCGTGASVSFIFGGDSFASCLFTGNGTGFAGGWSNFNNCEFRENGSGATVYKCTFTDCDISENDGNGVTAFGDHYLENPRLRLTNCNVSNNGGYGVWGDGGLTWQSVLPIECTNTKVSDNVLGGLFGIGGTGFTLVECEISSNGGPAGTANGLGLTRCVVWGNEGGLFSPSDEIFPGGISLLESTYHANRNGMSAESALGDPAQITIRRSIVSGTLAGRGVPQCSAPLLTLSVECSDIFGNAAGDDVCLDAGPNNFSLDPLFCDASGGDFTLAADSPCAPANSPASCELIGALPVGCQVLAIEPPASPQLRFAVGQNRPNPFNPSTVIDYTLPVTMPVALRIYDPAGRLVRTLVEGAMEAGNHAAVWDGRDAGGRNAASGIYYCRLEGEGYGVATRKMILVK